MKRHYFIETVMNQNVIWFEENGYRVSFLETPGNSDYENYLKWVAEGNEPEVIAEPTE